MKYFILFFIVMTIVFMGFLSTSAQIENSVDTREDIISENNVFTDDIIEERKVTSESIREYLLQIKHQE